MSRERAAPLHADATLPSEARRALAAYRQIAPEDEARSAMLAALERELSRSLEEAPRNELIDVGAPHRRWLRLYVGLFALASLGTLAVLVARDAGRTPAAPVQAVATRERATQASVSSVQQAVEPAAPPAALPPVVPTQAPAHPLPRARAALPKRAEAAEATVPADPGAELALLSRAKQTLAASPARALALTAEHAQRYPSGVLAEEREVIAIEALARVGKLTAARARADAFRAAHPRSAHLQRLSVVLQPR